MHGKVIDQQKIQDELIRLGRIVPVNTLDAIINKNYFINFVNSAYKTTLSSEKTLSESGLRKLDAAFYCWATKTLHNEVNLNSALSQFDIIEKCYSDPDRYYHRGLGHPRSLFPALAQMVYKRLFNPFTATLTELSIEEMVKQIDDMMLTKKINEAQEILSAFYHDIVHRNDKKADNILTELKRTPITSLMIDKVQDTLRVEEQSCISAELALKELGIPDQHIIPVLLAIISTIPFSKFNHPEDLKNRFLKASKDTLSPTETNRIIDIALSVSNRDIGSYGSDTLDEFNKKSWAMMLERFPKLAKSDHTLSEEAEAISLFYHSHQELDKKIKSGARIYESLKIDNPETKALNKKAETTISKDILLQGLQLGSLATLIAIISKSDKQLLNQPVNKVTEHASIKTFLKESKNHSKYPDDLPSDVVEVLKKHGQECKVNGISFMRGSNNAAIALQCVKLFGTKAILSMAEIARQMMQSGENLTSTANLEILSNHMEHLFGKSSKIQFIRYASIASVIGIGLFAAHQIYKERSEILTGQLARVKA